VHHLIVSHCNSPTHQKAGYDSLNNKTPVIRGGPVPIIHVYLFEGRTLDQKRKLVDKMTDAVVTSLDVKPEDVRIILQEMAKDNCATAGALAMDKKG
jgi:4-oxalocrotonate tautomerase